MATQLNPGADQALVAAAYRASMANVPLDYSKAFTAIAEGYATGLEGIQAAIKPLVQDMFAEIPEQFQDLVKNTLKNIGDRARYEIFGKDEYTFDQISKVKFDEKQQALYDSDLSQKHVVRETGKFRPVDKSNKTRVKALQRRLQEMYGPDAIDFYKDGVLQTGEDAIDGDFGTATKAAYEKFKKQYTELSKTQPFYRGESEKLKKSLSEGGFFESYWTKDMEEQKEEGNKDYHGFNLTTPKGYKKALEWAKKQDEELIATATKRLEGYQSLIPQTIVPGQKNKNNHDYTFYDDNNQPVNADFRSRKDHLKNIKNNSVIAQSLSGDDKRDAIAKNDDIFQTTREGEKDLIQQQIIIANMIRDGNVNPEAMGGKSIGFLSAVARRGAPDKDGSRIMKGYTEDGNPILVWVDKYNKPIINPTDDKAFTATAEDLETKYVVRSDAELEVNIANATQTEMVTRGQSGIKFNGQEYVNNITNLVDTENKFQDATNTTQLDMDGTYVEAVWGVGYNEAGKMVTKPSILNDALYAELTKLGDKFNFDGSTDKLGNATINAKDFVTVENYSALASYLTNYNPTAVNAFANFMKPSAQGYYNQGKSTRKTESKGIELGSGYVVEGYSKFGTWRKPQVVLDMRDKIMDPSKIEVIDGWDGYIYTPQADDTWKTDNPFYKENDYTLSTTRMYDHFSIPMGARPSSKGTFTTVNLPDTQAGVEAWKKKLKPGVYKLRLHDGKKHDTYGENLYTWDGTSFTPKQ